jgi:intein/homing endonuclease
MRKTKEEFVATDGDDMLFSQEFPCLIGKTRVSTNGGIVMLSDLRNYAGWSVDGNPITAWASKGTKQVFRVTTSLGYSTVGTFDHVVPTIDAGDIGLGELNGHTIALVPQEFGNEQKKVEWKAMFGVDCTIHVDEQTARFLGYFVGDGCYHDRTVSICCDGKDQDVIKDVHGLMVSLFGNCYERVVGNKNGGVELRVGSVDFKKVMERFGIWQPENPHRRVVVPDVIFQSPKNIVREFLSGLFEADGFCGYEGNRVSLFAKGKDFLRDIQVLFLGFGITSRLTEENKTDGAGITYT